MKRVMVICLMSLYVVFSSQPNAQSAEPLLKDLGNGVCVETQTGLMWQVGKSSYFTDEKAAKECVEKMDLAGFTDWRFPTMKEAKHLLDIFDKHRNGDCKISRLKSKYWLNATMHGIDSGKFGPNDECGGGYEFISKDKGAVRAVR